MDYEKFFEALKNNEALLKEYTAFMEAKASQNDEAGYAAIIEFAAAKGYTVTIEDIAEAKAAGRKMDENELMLAQGGKCSSNYHTSCSSTYKSDENCWFDDECTGTVYYYKISPECQTTYKMGCMVADYCGGALRNYGKTQF